MNWNLIQNDWIPRIDAAVQNIHGWVQQFGTRRDVTARRQAITLTQTTDDAYIELKRLFREISSYRRTTIDAQLQTAMQMLIDDIRDEIRIVKKFRLMITEFQTDKKLNTERRVNDRRHKRIRP